MPRISAETASFAAKASASLFNDKPTYASVKRRPILFEIASVPAREPLNREEGLFDKFLAISDKRHLKQNDHGPVQYWTDNQPYDLGEVFGTCVQFMDQHDAPLPKTTLPPAKDVESFINWVLEQNDLVTVDRQFEKLLDLSHNNILGAGNIGMIATRYMSRFSDIRPYQGLNINGVTVTLDTPDEIINNLMWEWSNKVSRFEIFTKGKNDGTGDQYYFWTHFFAACASNKDNIGGNVFQMTFARGNEIMIFVKDKLAKRGGTVSSHYEASLIGRNIGLALSEIMYGETDSELSAQSESPERNVFSSATNAPGASI